MALAYRSYNFGTFTTSTSLTITKPTSLAVGDLMVARIVAETALVSDLVLPSGWSEIGSIDDGARVMRVMNKIADSADVAATNFTFSVTNSCVCGGELIAISGGGIVISSRSEGSVTASGGNVTFTNSTITPNTANSVLLFFIWKVGTVKTFSNYAITTDNPSWTEISDVNTTLGIDHSISCAYANRSQTTATGDWKVTIDSGGTDSINGVFVIVDTITNVTVTPTVMDMTASIQAPLIGITILPTVMSIVSSIVSPVVTALSSIFTNTTKNVGTWTNTSKNASSAITDSFAVKPTTATRTNFTGSLGMRFTVSEPITVSQLGRLYVAGNSQNHTINLWISTDTVTPIANVTLTSSITSDANNFKYDDITPVVLTPGNTYAIASNETSGGDAWKDLWAYGSDIQSVFTDKFAVYHGTANTYPSLGATPSNIYNTCGMKYVTGVTFSNQSKNVATWTNQAKS